MWTENTLSTIAGWYGGSVKQVEDLANHELRVTEFPVEQNSQQRGLWRQAGCA